MGTATYEARLRQYQQSHSSTLDLKSTIRRLHEAIILCARKAAAQQNQLKRFHWENKGLRILHFLTVQITDARTNASADQSVCDRLLMVYHACSIHLMSGNADKAAELIHPLLQK